MTFKVPEWDQQQIGKCSDVGRGPGAESFQQFLDTVESALTKLRYRSDEAILVVSHEMFIKAAIWFQTHKGAFRTPRWRQEQERVGDIPAKRDCSDFAPISLE